MGHMNTNSVMTPLPHPSSERRKKLYYVTAGVVFILVSYGAGFWSGAWRAEQSVVVGPGSVAGKNTAPPAYLSKDVNFQQFWDVWSLIQHE